MQADHTGAALERVECPADDPYVFDLYVGGSRAPYRVVRLGEQLSDLYEKYRHDFRIRAICEVCG